MGSVFIKNGIGMQKKLYRMDGSAPETYQYNINSSNTYFAKTALNNAIAGSFMRVLTIGDGTDAGVGSDASGGGGLRSQSWVSQLAPLLSTRFSLTVPFQNVFGGAGKSVTSYGGYNPLLTIGASTLSSSDTGPGGQLWFHNSTSGAFRFTPTSSFDVATVYWIDNPPARDIQITTDTGVTSPSTLVGNGTGALRVTDVRCSPNANYIELNSLTGTNIGWLGVETYNSSGSGKILLQNCGWENSASGDWAGSSGGAARPILGVPAMAPHLIFINLNITDMFLETPISIWQSNIQEIINANKDQSSIVICTSNPLSTTKYGSEGAQAPYFAAIRDLALQNGLPFIDIKTLLGGTWNAANALGYMSDDQNMLAAGYAAKAAIMDNFFAVMAAVP